MAIKASESTVFATKKASFSLTPNKRRATVWHLNSCPPITIDGRVKIPAMDLYMPDEFDVFRVAISFADELMTLFIQHDLNDEIFKEKIVDVCKWHGYEWSIETTTREGGY